ncbi:MAG: protein-disulfide reductase DsbD [Xanthomonadaceae bacterium]|jgi:thiol:disulfide interchange protein DsbD|nr:protein-disulfide reductase DsbD [Xanthomonadaceae bacterium]
MSSLPHRCLVLFLSLLPAAALAVSEADLLPVDEAFRIKASAPSRDRLEVNWRIADGYYLYRHRTSVTVDGGGFQSGELRLPPGHAYHDEFFGDVETYRDTLTATLPGTPAAGASKVTLVIRYQGCADAGICYPPQRKAVEVTLPAETGAAIGGLPMMPTPQAGGLLFAGPALPEERAFGLEATADGGNSILLRFTAAPGYYLYRDQTRLKLENAPGIHPDPPIWPAGKVRHDEHFGNVVVFFNQVEVALPLRRERADAAKATLVATFQGCQDGGICYPPMTRRIQVSLPEGRPSIPPAAAAATATTPGTAPVDNAEAGSAADSAAPTDSGTDAAADPAISAGGGNAGAAGTRNDNALRTAERPAPTRRLWQVLLFAMLGGVVLNLMPCVLPILSLKALGLVQSGESCQRARGHAIWYTLGVVISFGAIGALALALRSAGQAAGWGFQLQHPWFIAGLAYLIFVMGLSLSGVVTLGAGMGGIGQRMTSRSGPAGDFFTGMLACVVASPCIGPFMGTALAFAFVAPPVEAMAVFLMLGLGLALPFLLIGFIPALGRRLPKPGAWMETLKQVLAFPMYLTTVWLLWVLGSQRGVNALTLVLGGAVVLALGLWWYERSRWRSSMLGRALALVVIVVGLLPIWGVARLSGKADGAATEVAYSAQRLERFRAENRVVFVNMTADWCVTCKANEYGVLSSDDFHAAMRRADAVHMKGDWTNGDPEISAFLKSHDAVGVPLYVVYGPGAAPKVLPPILTQVVVEAALVSAKR